MNEIITIGKISIKQDSQGRYSLNDLHKAAGSMEKHSPNRWTRTGNYKTLVQALTPKMALAPVYVAKGGKAPGTYVCKELVYAYAMWISADFHIIVIQTFDAVIIGQKEWAAARIQGKLVRHDLTDVIQLFVRYAISQGSTSAPKYFMNITNMQYKALEFVKQSGDKHFRDSLTLLQHNQLMTIEFAVRQALLEGMEEGLHYKDIFQKAKAAALELAEPLKRLTGKAKEPNIPLAQRIAMVSTHTIGMK